MQEWMPDFTLYCRIANVFSAGLGKKYETRGFGSLQIHAGRWF